MKKTLILGGVRCGKSAYAERLALDTKRPKLYLATATGGDEEMIARIEQHISRRGDAWQTVEEPVEIAKILSDPRWQEHVILVDCLTLWLSNLMAANAENIANRRSELANAVRDSKATVIMVTNEVGLGIMPMNTLARQFADEAGLLHQAVAGVCDTVALVTAGLPMLLKSPAA